MSNLILQVYPYRATNVQKLYDTHKAGRREFCEFILNQDEDFPDFVIFSDEKNFTERVKGNRQNERYWDWFNPYITEENRVQGGRKLMCWAALAEGRVILHWFAEGETENQYNYLDMLKTKLWPVVRGRATRWRSVSAPKRLFLAPKRSRRFFTFLHQNYFFSHQLGFFPAPKQFFSAPNDFGNCI